MTGGSRKERQASATPRKIDVSSTSMSATLYPDWVLSWAGKRSSPDTPQPYRMNREGAGGRLTLEEELDASSVFDPLQSSQGAEGPQTPPHYSEAPTNIPPFDIAKVGMLTRMSPITDQQNALLNVAPGSPVRRAAPPGLDRGQGGSGPSSCSDSPMSFWIPSTRIKPGTGSEGVYPAGDTLDVRRTGRVAQEYCGGRWGRDGCRGERRCRSGPRLNSLRRPPGQSTLFGALSSGIW